MDTQNVVMWLENHTYDKTDSGWIGTDQHTAGWTAVMRDYHIVVAP